MSKNNNSEFNPFDEIMDDLMKVFTNCKPQNIKVTNIDDFDELFKHLMSCDSSEEKDEKCCCNNCDEDCECDCDDMEECDFCEEQFNDLKNFIEIHNGTMVSNIIKYMKNIANDVATPINVKLDEAEKKHTAEIKAAAKLIDETIENKVRLVTDSFTNHIDCVIEEVREYRKDVKKMTDSYNKILAILSKNMMEDIIDDNYNASSNEKTPDPKVTKKKSNKARKSDN